MLSLTRLPCFSLLCQNGKRASDEIAEVRREKRVWRRRRDLLHWLSWGARLGGRLSLVLRWLIQATCHCDPLPPLAGLIAVVMTVRVAAVSWLQAPENPHAEDNGPQPTLLDLTRKRTFRKPERKNYNTVLRRLAYESAPRQPEDYARRRIRDGLRQVAASELEGFHS